MTHKDEIKYWAEHKNCTDVWAKEFNEQDWELVKHYKINWSCKVCKFIVDDEWAELRKAQADGKQLQRQSNFKDWEDDTLRYADMKYTTPKDWRIKPEEPVYEYQVIYKIGRKGIFHITSEYHKDKEEFTEKRGELIFIGMYEPSKRERK